MSQKQDDRTDRGVDSIFESITQNTRRQSEDERTHNASRRMIMMIMIMLMMIMIMLYLFHPKKSYSVHDDIYIYDLMSSFVTYLNGQILMTHGCFLIDPIALYLR
jgi:hypothetical protein